MIEMVLDARTLPDQIFQLIRTEKVKVRELDGEVRLTPIVDAAKGCPLRGMFADGKISVDEFIESKQAEKGLE